jgi:hypothetical protein
LHFRPYGDVGVNDCLCVFIDEMECFECGYMSSCLGGLSEILRICYDGIVVLYMLSVVSCVCTFSALCVVGLLVMFLFAVLCF